MNNFKWHLEINTKRDVYRLLRENRGISLLQEEGVWGESREDFTEEA